MSRTHHRYGQCLRCGAPLQRTERHTVKGWDGAQREYFTYPAFCPAHVGTTPVSMIKDGHRGYLWAVCPSHESYYGDADLAPRLRHGWAPSEDAALEQARQAAGTPVARTGSSPAHRICREYLERRRQERRESGAARNRDRRDSHKIEYLYDTDGTTYPITKITPLRVYFQWTTDTYKAPEPEDRIAYVSRARLAGAPSQSAWARRQRAQGYEPPQNPYVYVHARGYFVSVMTKAAYEEYCRDNERRQREQERQREHWRRTHAGENVKVEEVELPPTGGWTVRECRRRMQSTHPDRGGDPAEFRLWRDRYEHAKRASAPS